MAPVEGTATPESVSTSPTPRPVTAARNPKWRSESVNTCGSLPRHLFTSRPVRLSAPMRGKRSEEHTSELQSRGQLVCRLLPQKTTSRARFSYDAAKHFSHPPRWDR